jgi:hypothetical protein
MDPVRFISGGVTMPVVPQKRETGESRWAQGMAGEMRLGLVLLAIVLPVPAAMAVASSYIYGLHEPGGESHMRANKGWIVFTEAIGSDPTGIRCGFDGPF